MKGNLVRQMELAAGALLVLNALGGLVAHFHVSVCLLGPPGTSWLAFGKLWQPFFDTWGLLGSLESVLGEFLGFLGAPGTFPGTLGRVLPGA